jgi:hypothetical protein
MAGKGKSARAVENTAGTRAAQKFTVEKLQANCRELFGISTSTFAGATYGMTGMYTVEEMRAHLEAWKKKGVK